MDKGLGTNLHLQRFFTRAKQIHLHLFSPSPLQCWTRVQAISPGVSTLYWGVGVGVGGEEATHFKTDNSAFFKTPFQKHRKLMQLHKCPKEFCPPLSDFHVS